MPHDPAQPMHAPTDATLPAATLDALIDEHLLGRRPRLLRLWRYYRNPMSALGPGDDAGRAYRLAQEQGLPPRLRDPHDAPRTGRPARERVIENDIAWRVHALVDFMVGRAPVVQSLAPDRRRASLINAFLRGLFDAHGGIAFFQDMTLLGSVYGFVDVLVSPVDDRDAPTPLDPAAAATRLRLELVEAPRAIPLLNPNNYRRLDAYILHFTQTTNRFAPAGILSRVRDRVLGERAAPAGRREHIERTLVWTADAFQSFRGVRHGFTLHRDLVEQRTNRLGRVPVVHIQNLSQPLAYDGLSEVEPLIPLQDELNTRLCDRANRVTFQSFKMYLGKGIERFTERPIGPGQMWATDNPDATIQEFGGDAHSPSEQAHVAEVREALDKASGVTPLVAGVLRDRIGNLTSENALRVVMMGLLAKNAKKRIAYGAGIERLCELALHAADVHGLLPNAPDERAVRIDWPDPFPDSESQQLRNARVKLELGVPRRQVLTELGYGELLPAANHDNPLTTGEPTDA